MKKEEVVLQEIEIQSKSCFVNELQIARKEIDKIDQQIVKLLENRMEAISKVIAYKTKNKVEVLDTKREEIVLENIRKAIKNSEYEETILKTFNDIMKRSKEYQVVKKNK